MNSAPGSPPPRAVHDRSAPVPERPLWLLAGGGLTVVGLVGVGVTWWHTVARQELTTHAAVRDVRELQLRDLGNADVVIRGSDRPDVAITRELRWVGLPDDVPAHREAVSGATLLIDNPCSGRSNCTIVYTIEAPRTSTARVTLTSGDVQASELADLQVTARSGDVAAQDIRRLDVHTESGDIEVCRVATALLSASSGDVSACSMAGPVEVETTTGKVDVEVTAGDAGVRVTTTSGDAQVRLPTGAAYDVRAETRTGHRNVAVSNDPGAARKVFVTTRSGDIDIIAPSSA